jgi:hypothetical protein
VSCCEGGCGPTYKAAHTNTDKPEIEWCVLFSDGHRLQLTEKHCRQVVAFHTNNNHNVRLQSRIVHPWIDHTQL